MHACSYVCRYTCVAGVHACIGQRTTFSFFLGRCLPYFETGSLISWKSLIRPGWLASKHQ